MIAAFLISWIGLAFGGYFLTPLIPKLSPDPVISGYVGFFSGVVGLGLIPLAILIWLLFKILFGYKVGRKVRRLTQGVWIVSILLFALTILFGAKNYLHEY